MGIYRELKTGVLVIGGGGAALKSALAAMESGADVLVITKGAFGKSGATYYSVAESGGYCCPSGHYDPTDSEQIFYEDILNAAQGAAKPELAKILAEEAVAEKNSWSASAFALPENRTEDISAIPAAFPAKGETLRS